MDLDALALTVFRGRVGDHNDRAMSGATVVGHELADRLGLPPVTIGVPAQALNSDWEEELLAARADLRAMGTRYETVLSAGQVPVTAMTRCAVALATLPVVAANRPDVAVVWFDAHADINTPDDTTTGYLGGLALSGPLGWWDTGLGAGVRDDQIVLVGTRDLDPAEQQHVDDGTITLVHAGPDLPERLRSAVGGRPVYIHIDCDVLEPGIVPTDYRIAAGLTLDDLHAAALVLAESELVGLEIAEFESSCETAGPAASPVALLDALRPLLTGTG